jgi:hypothetical protein
MIVCSRKRSADGECPVDGVFMIEKNISKEEEKGTGDSPRVARKPYSKPEFRYERAFETMALSCGKIRASQALCRFNRKNS